MTQEEFDDFIREEFPTVKEWVIHWLNNVLNNSEANPTLFYGSSSYMDISELLREADPIRSNPCAIVDSDVHSNVNDDFTIDNRELTFHICCKAFDALDGSAVDRAKTNCLDLANEFRRFVVTAKKVGNKNARVIKLERNIDSNTPFLDGWQSVSIVVRWTESFCGVPMLGMYHSARKKTRKKE